MTALTRAQTSMFTCPFGSRCTRARRADNRGGTPFTQHYTGLCENVNELSTTVPDACKEAE